MAAFDPKDRRGDALLTGVALVTTIVSTVVRFWYVVVAHHPRHHVTSDVVSLLDLAERFIAAPGGQTVADTIWPPGTSAILGTFMAFDASLDVAALAQALGGALVPLLIGHATAVALGRRAGLVALVFASLHFGLIHYGGLFLSEQLFQLSIAMAVWASLVALRLAEARRTAPSAGGDMLVGVGCGAAWAFASTFRPNALPVALAVGGALSLHALRARRPALSRMLAAGLLAFVLGLAPLALRCSALKGGGFCPVSSNVAMNMALGQSGELSGLAFVSPAGEQLSTTWSPPSLLQHGYNGIGTVPASIYDTRGVLKWVGERLVKEPGRFLLRATGNMLDLFRLEYWPDDDGVGAERLVMVAKQLFFLAVIAPALVALAMAVRASWRTRSLPTLWCFVLAVVGAVLVTAALSMGEARYRMPFDGVLILCAASLVAEGDRPRGAAPGPGAWPRPTGRATVWAFTLVATAAALGVALVAVGSSPRWHALGALERVVQRRLVPAANVTVKPAAELAEPRQPGSAWDAPGNHVFACTPGCEELRLTFSEPRRDGAVELSLDNNDRYELVFYRGAAALARARVDAHAVTPGVRIETIAVPASARADGFDAIGVRPLYGDGNYSLGHLRLVDEAVAAP